MLRTIRIHIEGTHCPGCKTLIESEVGSLAGVQSVQVDYVSGKSRIRFDNELVSKEQITETIERLNYRVRAGASGEKVAQKPLSANLLVAGVLLVGFVSAYLTLQRSGLLEILARLNEQRLSFGLILLVGFLAGFHCVGMCGGLVVAYAARYQATCKEEKLGFSPLHLQYNLGRFVSYTAIGAVLGGFGSFFGISPTFTGLITLAAGLFMVLMGLSLLGNFAWLERITPRLPASIGRFLYGQRRGGKPRGPFIIGLLNGFMPCGPLQAMQLYALGSGSIARGAISMGLYALGTVPLMFGFGSFLSLIGQERSRQVMKLGGVIVLILGALMLNRGLVHFGFGFRSPTPTRAETLRATPQPTATRAPQYQTARMELTYRGYVPNALYIKNDVPVRWVIDVKQMTRCTDEIIMPEYSVRKKLTYGENVVEFIPKKVGEVKFSCWMRMVWGKFVVTE